MKPKSTIAKTINNKPSIALQAMVDGLRFTDTQPQQQILMSTFGSVEGGGISNLKICYGCAATWSIQNLTGRMLSTKEVEDLGILRANNTLCGWGTEEVAAFEEAIDCARVGELGALFDFCGVLKNHRPEFDDCFNLSTDNWKRKIPAVEELIAELKDIGL